MFEEKAARGIILCSAVLCSISLVVGLKGGVITVTISDMVDGKRSQFCDVSWI